MPPKSNRVMRVESAVLAQWTPEQETAVEALAAVGWHGPQDARAVEVATAAGVDVLTLAEWVRDPEFTNAVMGRMLAIAQLRFPPVLWRLLQDAEAGKATAQKVLVEALGLGKKAAGALIQYNDLRGSQDGFAEGLQGKSDREIAAEFRRLAGNYEERLGERAAGLGE